MAYIKNTLGNLVLALCLGTFALPSVAHAYLNPYDVLLSQDLLLPASSREAEARIARQQRESERRREEEFNAVFDEQHPEVPEVVFEENSSEEVFRAAAPEVAGADDQYVDREFLSLMRTLERVKQNQTETALRQQALAMLEAEGFHSGAPLGGKGFLQTNSSNLAPTGAGTVVAFLVMLIAIGWTWRRLNKAETLAKQQLPPLFLS